MARHHVGTKTSGEGELELWPFFTKLVGTRTIRDAKVSYMLVRLVGS
jgi:hypothetical protein